MTAPLRIAQVAPLFESVPPPAYGGTERVVAALCDGLVALGHDVTLYASGDSHTAARLIPGSDLPLRERMSREEMEVVAPHRHLRLLADVYAAAADYDVIHSHVDLWTLPFAHASATPTVLTLHGRLDVLNVQQTLPLYPDVPIVSISDAQRAPLAAVPVHWAGTVHHGQDLTGYLTAAPPRGDHLVFVGRIHPDKRPDQAVEIARATGRRLRVAAKIDPVDLAYYEQQIQPLLTGDGVDFVGELPEDAKPEFFASAAGTLFPSDWPEPFGLVMIESMAAGTPVIALRRGSVPEIVVDGVTGFICDDVTGMIEAVGRLSELDPQDCRRHAATRFGVEQMCRGYEAIYRDVVAAATGVAAGPAPQTLPVPGL